MDLRAFIESTFCGKAFERPLFYAYEGGLRFELSEGGTAINQVFVALKKAEEICQSIFQGQESIGVCLRFFGPEKFLTAKAEFRELKNAQIEIPGERCIWTVRAPEEDELDEGAEEYWHHVAFLAPKALLVNFLWCSFVQDFGRISPRPGFQVYLFSIEKQLLMWPYDDRGMDVVGPNHEALRGLYFEFGKHLLDYDRPTMAAVFER